MPVYNCERYIAESLESLCLQTYKNFEVIIINDGSTDRTLSLINECKDERFKVFSFANGGVAAALNRGLIKARGEIIARMDADDISLKDRLEKQVEFLNAGYDIVGCDYSIINEDGLVIENISVPKSDSSIKKKLRYGPPFAHGSIMAKRSSDFWYDERRFLKCEDYALWCKLMLKDYKFGNVTDTLYMYRVSADQVTQKRKLKLKLDSAQVSCSYLAKSFFKNA